MSNVFYVYAHYRKSDGRIFYIGKGSGRRSHNPGGRSLYWRRVVAKHGRTVRILKRNMPEQCALSLERALIATHGREKLCNLSDGGDGVSGATPENRAAKARSMLFQNSPVSDRRVFEFYHSKYGKVCGPKCLVRKAFGLESSHISRIANGKANKINGWSLYENRHLPEGKSGPNKANADLVMSYRHQDGRGWSGNPHYFAREFGLNVGSLYRLHKGLVRSHHGWRLA